LGIGEPEQKAAFAYGGVTDEEELDVDWLGLRGG